MPDSCHSLIKSPDSLAKDSEALIQQIAAAMYPALDSGRSPVVAPPDVDSVLLHLTNAMTEAKNEANKERSLRMVLEIENEVMRHKQALLSNSEKAPFCFSGDSNSITTGHPVPYFDYSRSTTSGSVHPSLLNQSMNLSECLNLFSSMPPHLQDALYMSYFESGFDDIDTECIVCVYQPNDFTSLCFVLLSISGLSVPSSLVKFSMEDLKTILDTMSPSPLRCGISPTTTGEESLFEDTPRMNLLDALNVTPDDDISHIITVRKCHKLGFKSNIFLKQYFSKYGRVDRVVLLPMRTKQVNKGNRPSSMGFVVFENSEVVRRVLETPTHTIKGWPIEVRNFVKPADKEEFSW